MSTVFQQGHDANIQIAHNANRREMEETESFNDCPCDQISDQGLGYPRTDTVCMVGTTSILCEAIDAAQQYQA